MLEEHREIPDPGMTTLTRQNLNGNAPSTHKPLIQPPEQVIYLTFSAGNSKHAWLSTH